MRHPDDIERDIRERFDRDYPDWARGKGSWPLRINLKPPTRAERSENPVACHAWADDWARYSGPGVLDYANARFPTGIHSMPKTLTFSSPGAAATAVPDTQAIWRRCGTRLTELARTFPGAQFDRIIRRLTDLPDQDYECLSSTARWIADNPTSGMLLRQLPIEGINTKWLARHATLLLALLGDEQPREDLEYEPSDEQNADDDAPVSRRIQLHQRLGLRIPPYLVQVAVIDPVLRQQLAGMRHFAAGVDDLNQWPRTPDTVVILENKETGYAITDDHPGTVVLHGAGFSVAHYARIAWVRSARKVIYWGDIDLPGLAFISDLRGLGVRADTVHMDLATLDRFRHLAVEGATATRIDLPHLTNSERRLYEHLLDHAANHQTGLLLEQERIAWDHAYEVLADAIRS
ncbi:Wadjet anti-phage system protein JetD domain-containing protein [Nocardia sp. NPDC004654]|uniref:DUF3322 domain-containing protein n=1 Tax=Nocardia sp. NPDC004654 TaxID=3154776 RepID=UPI0033BC046E